VETDFAEQKREFIRLLGTIVHRVDTFDVLRDHLRELAHCHPEICESDDNHYAIGAALFWMLEQILGDDFTPETYAAWMNVYRVLSEDVKASARDLALAS
jgi:hemoglobin-like flavoprotein